MPLLSRPVVMSYGGVFHADIPQWDEIDVSAANFTELPYFTRKSARGEANVQRLLEYDQRWRNPSRLLFVRAWTSLRVRSKPATPYQQYKLWKSMLEEVHGFVDGVFIDEYTLSNDPPSNL